MFVSFSSALRFIPACAGSTYRVEDIDYLVEVHPRMRGVH